MAARKVAIKHIGVGSVFKVATIMSLVGFVVWMLAATLIYFGLEQTGVIDSINSLIGGVGGDQVIDMALVLSGAALVGLIGVVFTAVISPLLAVIYNSIADMVGGITYTMSNRVR
ncbi:MULTISPECIES: DUF3566 domain-containing protein [Corynebacterium]|uniref:Uncharacterized protein n=1 Tax=Corynebacterium riegelii TaxID=156976 RepID=A0A0K1RDX1_9CORY|nr:MULTISPECIES: DUF3566 domain-containing protein [Corynebacterium]AKV59381.1 hypothetical protein AK829_09815 [Corynebacterium riegelii]MDK7180903.1 DUF3566 domain-containing protein [Corynebacterium riegelii]OFT77330.1 hypothetical protein HMPREF3104_02605 [Corynebacterium sp. HMSC30G07]PLA12582.1 hypothetical protein CYJ48_07385 [Corynebacterium riegelii]QQU84568.1 DUF3566 domain-containing protein [Corynebacterium riegelii]